MTHQHEELTGTVEKFLFQNPDNGYAVAVIKVKNNATVVTGYLPAVHVGELVSITGSWITHPKFGRQFEAKNCTVQQPTTVIGIKKYLASGLIKGIGPVYAERLVDHFGSDVLEIIDKNPERLEEVPGIGKGRLTKIIEAWKDQKEIANIMVFLREKDISPAYATKIYKKYGHNAVAVLNENPYRLTDDIWGIGFKIADQIAQNMGLEKDSIKRIKAGIIFAITTEVGNGHLYVELQALKNKTLQLLELFGPEVEKKIKFALHELYDHEKIKLISYNDQHFVTHTPFYFSEKGTAQKVQNLNKYPSPHTFDIDALYQQLRAQQSAVDIVLNEDQQRGILACLQNKITIITGGPGTGKTTIIKKLLTILDAKNVRYKLAAPTGRAAKRINEGTGKQASTIHRLLEYDFTTHGFVKNEDNALQLDFLIVDEASMIDIFLAHAILRALPLPAHLVLIGDIDQLPSVGAGNFLNDLIASNSVTCIRLTEIFRQAQDSLIIVNAHRINKGEFPTSFLPDAQRDFRLIKETEPQNIEHHLTNIFKSGLSAYGIKPKDAVVLVPMNRGIVGTQAINHTLQSLLNPIQANEQFTYGGTTFKVGDRVMQIRNNYDKLVFNGDIGTLESINLEDRVASVRYFERLVEYECSEFDELVLAYAITIHKSQGSEYPAVIVPIFMQHFTLLARNLIYTAITRAKKLCIFVGQTKAIAMAIRNNKSVVRTTFLQQFLTTDLTCR